MPGAAIAGIVVGVLVLSLLVCFVVSYQQRRRKASRGRLQQAQSPSSTEIVRMGPGRDVDYPSYKWSGRELELGISESVRSSEQSMSHSRVHPSTLIAP